MRSEHLREGIDWLKESGLSKADMLKEALALLERAHNSLDVIEGEVQDLKESQPDKYYTGIMDAVKSMPTDQIGRFLEVAKQAAGIELGYTSPEFDSLSILKDAVAPND